jgi:hypothetical protein
VVDRLEQDNHRPRPRTAADRSRRPARRRGHRPGRQRRRIALADSDDETRSDEPEPTATLLPALDPTSMGWKNRGWLFGIDPSPLFDQAGNIGPTLWWNGEIIGSWAVIPHGDVRTTVLADRGTAATHAVERAATNLQQRLHGAVVTPAARTPLERSISDNARPRSTPASATARWPAGRSPQPPTSPAPC